jgi:hypothetical protein
METIGKTKKALLDRLERALRDTYHNATPDHPLVPDALAEDYWVSFNDWVSLEVGYIREGLCMTAREYAKAKKLGFPCKGTREAFLVSRINDYGKLYTWGRGGRTLAPDGLINQRGGGSFSIKGADCFAEYSNEALVELIQTLEAFNNYIERWNSRENLAYMWREYCEERRRELASEAKDTRKTLKRLAREALALAGVAGEAACGALRREVLRLRGEHKALIAELRGYNEALNY